MIGSKRVLTWMLMLLFVTCMPTFAGSPQKSGEPGSKIRVTGCLQKSDEADVFSFIGDNGKNYELVSTSVQLSKHVGHKVTVRGILIGKEDEENEGTEESKGWSGKIQVISLTTVADSCK